MRKRVAALGDDRGQSRPSRAITLGGGGGGADRGYDAEELRERASGDECQAPCRSEPDPAVADRQSMDARPATVDMPRASASGNAIEEGFGWMKDGCRPRPPDGAPVSTGSAGRSPSLAAAYNLVRLPKLHRGDALMARRPAFAKAFAGRWRIARDGHLVRRCPRRRR